MTHTTVETDSSPACGQIKFDLNVNAVWNAVKKGSLKSASSSCVSSLSSGESEVPTPNVAKLNTIFGRGNLPKSLSYSRNASRVICKCRLEKRLDRRSHSHMNSLSATSGACAWHERQSTMRLLASSLPPRALGTICARCGKSGSSECLADETRIRCFPHRQQWSVASFHSTAI